MEGDRHGLELKKKMKKVGFFEFQCYSTQITEKKNNKQTKKTKQKWLVLPGEICFLSSSQLYRNILCVDKGTK